MTDQPDKNRSEADAELEREIRKDRTFNMAEAIGRLAGPGSMKGASPVARQQQAEAEIEAWLKDHLADCEGALHAVLLRQIKGTDLLLNHLEQPLDALATHCKRVLGSDCLLKDLVRDVDAEWGSVYGERPYFDKEDCPPHPKDPYTNESVRKDLGAIVDQLSPAKM